MERQAPVLRGALLAALATLYVTLVYGGLHVAPWFRGIYEALQMKELPIPTMAAMAGLVLFGKIWWLAGALLAGLSFLLLRGSLGRFLPGLLIATILLTLMCVLAIWSLSLPITKIQQQLQGSKTPFR